MLFEVFRVPLLSAGDMSFQTERFSNILCSRRPLLYLSIEHPAVLNSSEKKAQFLSLWFKVTHSLRLVLPDLLQIKCHLDRNYLGYTVGSLCLRRSQQAVLISGIPRWSWIRTPRLDVFENVDNSGVIKSFGLFFLFLIQAIPLECVI